MEEKNCKCPQCEKRAREEKESEELNLAVLVALVPVLAITLFSNIGLI